MRTRRTDRRAEIALMVPENKAAQVEKAILAMLELAGHTVLLANDQGEEPHSVEEVFPEAHPGMVLAGFRLKLGLTQIELAARLAIGQNRVSDMEHGRRPISKAMAAKLAEVFNMPYQAFL
jgi:DNA-binding XRE family transcriptional regulator